MSQVVLSAYCGDDRFALLSELRLAGRSPIKQRKTEVPLQRVDCIADGGRDARQSFWLGSEGSVFGYRREHQTLIDTRYRRAQHFEILEKYCQFYTDFRKPPNAVTFPGRIASDPEEIRHWSAAPSGTCRHLISVV